MIVGPGNDFEFHWCSWSSLSKPQEHYTVIKHKQRCTRVLDIITLSFYFNFPNDVPSNFWSLSLYFFNFSMSCVVPCYAIVHKLFNFLKLLELAIHISSTGYDLEQTLSNHDPRPQLILFFFIKYQHEIKCENNLFSRSTRLISSLFLFSALN